MQVEKAAHAETLVEAFRIDLEAALKAGAPPDELIAAAGEIAVLVVRSVPQHLRGVAAALVAHELRREETEQCRQER